MSGSALMAPQINLDEFERRLRAAGSPLGPQEDPLDELERLVGLEAPQVKPQPKIFGFPPKAEAARLPPVHPLHVDEAAQASPETQPSTLEDASLRGALEDDALVQNYDPQQFSHQDGAAHADAGYHEAVEVDETMSAPRRSGRVAVTMGALVVIGAAGLVGAWVVKGAPGLPKTPPVIMAANGPTKIQPPSEDTVASPSDSASVLLKDQKGKSEPIKLVSSEEQPVDLQLQAKAQPVPAPAPIVALATPVVPVPAPVAAAPTDAPAAMSAPLAAASAMPAPATASAPPAPATSASAPPAPAAPATALSPTRSIALSSIGSTAAAPAAPAPFPEPKRVKTVSVRPDGSVISGGSETMADARPTADPIAAAAAAPATSDASAAIPDGAAQPANPPVPRARPAFDASASGAAQPATPKLDLPTKLAPKASTRAPTPKIDTTVASNAANQPPEAPAQRAQPQPQKTPLEIVPDIIQSVTHVVSGQPQTQVAAADPVATATTASGGSYAVQLAAPATDREAQSASARLQAKYAGELGGMQPTIHQADVNGRSIYRVRVSGMSKAEAVSLCQKLKATGGDAACFVARD